MNRKRFFEKVKSAGIAEPEDLQQVQSAYFLAKNVHSKQMRDDGERHFEHCKRVALYLLNYYRPSAEMISAALIHDTAEDGYVPAKFIERVLGPEVSALAEKLNKFRVVYDAESGGVISKHKKHLTEYYGGIDGDISACIIKFADRLDNLTSMHVWPEERQLRYLDQTEKYILPLGRDRLGFLSAESRFQGILSIKYDKLREKLNK